MQNDDDALTAAPPPTALTMRIIQAYSRQYSQQCLYSMCLKAKFQCHPARCLLPVEIMQRCGLATGPATVELYTAIFIALLFR